MPLLYRADGAMGAPVANRSPGRLDHVSQAGYGRDLPGGAGLAACWPR